MHMYQLLVYFLKSCQLVYCQPTGCLFVCQLVHAPASSIFSEIIPVSWISFRLALLQISSSMGICYIWSPSMYLLSQYLLTLKMYIKNNSWRPLSIAFFHWLWLLFLSIGTFFPLVLVSTDVDLVLLHIKYTVEVVPLYTYILCGLLSSDGSPCARSVECVFAHFYTLFYDSKCHWTVSCIHCQSCPEILTISS